MLKFQLGEEKKMWINKQTDEINEQAVFWPGICLIKFWH